MWLIVRLMVAFLGGIGVAQLIRWGRFQAGVPDSEDLIWKPNIPVTVERISANIALISWLHSAKSVRIYKGIHRRGIDQTESVIEVSESNQASIGGLDPYTRYDFELVFDDAERVCISERIIPFENLANFRDIGGYPTEDGHMVVWDKVYRSVSLVGLNGDDIDRLEQLNLHLVCDIRSAAEVEEAPDMLPTTVQTYLHLPAQAEVTRWDRLWWLIFRRHRLNELLQHVYIHVMIEQNPQIFAQIFRRLADESSYPVLIHCTAGKDRTGVVVALLLRLLGVPEQIVISDYTLSNHAYAFIQKLVAKTIRQLTTMGLKEKDVQPLLDANPRNMQAMLSYIDQHYGSVEDYIRTKVGIAPETIERIKSNLLV